MKMPARTSGFAISDILELNDAKPSQEEPDVQGNSKSSKLLCKLDVIKKKHIWYHYYVS